VDTFGLQHYAGATAISGVAAQTAAPPPFDPPHYDQQSGPGNVTDGALALAAIYAAAPWYLRPS
jgi:hypothetical protein